MATAPTKTRRRTPMTVADYMALPDDGCRYELIRGERVVSPSAFHAHRRVAGYIFSRLDEFVTRRGVGVVGRETDVVFGRHEVRRPDVHFISARRQSIIRGHLYGPPDLAVEITSPENGRTDFHDKRDDCERFGVREYWVIDIADGRRRAGLWYLKGGLYHGGLVEGSVLRSRILKGFSLKLAEVWKRAAG